MPRREYTRGNKIGSGGFGDVFACIRNADKLKVAMKVLKDLSEDSRARFAREAKLQASLQHPNIMPILEAHMDEEPPYLVMPLAGDSLRDMLGKESPETLINAFRSAAKAIEYAHTKKIIHRDLKPENLLYLPGLGRWVVADFGLGRSLVSGSATLTSTNRGLGSVAYMAPEQVKDTRSVDHRADIFALGKILYEICSGDLMPLDLDLVKMPPLFLHVVEKACHRDKSKRYQTVTEMIQDFDMLRANKATSTDYDTLNEMIDTIHRGHDYSRQTVEPLVAMLLDNRGDPHCAKAVYPKASQAVWKAISVGFSEEFLVLLRAYDEHVSDTISFEYCDVVADFYQRLFFITTSLVAKRIILQRLPKLAWQNNRWHVGKVLTGMCSNLTEPALILALRDALAEDTRIALWCKPYLQNLPRLPTSINEVLGK